MQRQFGIIGYPLSHSFSPAYFTKKFAEENISAAYTAFPLSSITNYPALLQLYTGLEGLSVTIPYKEAIIPCLDSLDDTAKEIGSVNCIALKNGISKGYNTDAPGFQMSLAPLLQSHHTHALILGTGGASRAVAYVLTQLGIAFQKVSRVKTKGDLTYEELTPSIIQRHTLIINTTPLGMYPHTAAAPPLPYDHLTPQHLLYDLIYNPEETMFLTLGKAQGSVIKNGHEMLLLQAEASWAIWQQ